MADKTDDLVISVSTDLSTVQRGLRRLGADIDATAGTIQKRFSAMGQGIDKSMTTALQARINDMVGIGTKGAKEWTGVLAEQGKEFERLRTKINPVFGVINRYKTSVVEIQTAHRIGAVSADEMTSAIQRERQAALASIAAIKQRNSALADTPVRGGSFNTANIAAQFQDIGVTAAMGMSPIQIALQQGTQLSAVLNQMGGAKSVIAGLGAAFASVISPVSLATIGIVGLTAAGAQYFSTFMEGSDKTAEAMRAEVELIQKVAQQWGAALPALQAYADGQQQLISQQDALNGLIAAREHAGAPLLEGLDEALGEVVDLQMKLSMLGDDQAAEKLREKFEELRTKVAEGNATQEDFNDLIAATKGILDSASLSGDGFIAMLNSLAGRAAAILPTMHALANDVERAFGGGGPARRYSRGGRPTLDLPDNAPTPDFAPNREDVGAENDRRLARANRRSSRAHAKTSTDRFFEDIEAIKARTVALAEEQAQLGMSYEAQTKRQIAFDLEQKALKDVREEARRKGDQDWQNAQISPEQVAKIDEVSDAYARQAQMLKDARAAQADFQDWINVGRDATRGFIDDLLNGASAGEAFANVLGKIGDKLLDMAMNDLFGGGNSGGPGLLGALFGGFGGGGSSSSPLSWLDDMFRAGGGPVQAGQPYIVGEKRPELFVPRTSGTIVPQVPSLVAAGGGSTSVPINISIDARGADREGLMRVERQVAALKRDLPGVVDQRVTTMRQRGVGMR